ncbi:hypothetical protein [Pseudoalteromonas piscicida]|nr:hypothetical protein [Pseudoalteromonas piscicida]
MWRNDAMLVRGIALLIGVFINQAIACQDKINELAFTRFHYGSEQDFPYQQLGVDTVRNKLFGREVLMAKADFKESEAIQFGEDVFISNIYEHSKYEVSYTVSPAPFHSKQADSFEILLEKISKLRKLLPICSEHFVDLWLDVMSVIAALNHPPSKLDVYIDKINKHILVFHETGWISVYPSTEQGRLVIGMGEPPDS